MWALLLLGCQGWIDQKEACATDTVYEWSDDLLSHILTGDQSGAFDYDPIDLPRTRIVGAYKAGSGNFSWDEEFDRAYWLSGVHVEGYGTVFHNGDLDLLYARTQEDTLGEETVTTHRVQREGCATTLQQWTPADAEDPLALDGALADFVELQGSYDSEESFSFSGEDDRYSYRGVWRANLARTFRWSSQSDDTFAAQTFKPDGAEEGEFLVSCGTNLLCEGSYTRGFEGELEQSYTIYRSGDTYAEVEGDYGYSGDGEEQWTYYNGSEPLQCTREIEDGACYETCEDGTERRC